MTEPLRTAREIAGLLGVNPETVLRWTRAGKLPGFRLPSGQLRYREADVIDRLQVRATPGPSGANQRGDAALTSSQNGSLSSANQRFASTSREYIERTE